MDITAFYDIVENNDSFMITSHIALTEIVSVLFSQ